MQYRVIYYMKRKAVYALAIGIAIAAVVILVMARVTSPSGGTSSVREEQPADSPESNDFAGIDISIENVTAERNQYNETNIQVQFRAFNRNTRSNNLKCLR